MTKPFKIVEQSKKSKARAGELTTAHGKLKTPFFMTIATRGAVKTLAAEDMRDLHAPIILSNTYHLFVRPGLEILKKVGGLHKFMNWDGPILTDSGGYQVFSLANKNRNPSQPPLNLRGGEKKGEPPLKVRGGRGSYESRNDEADYDVRLTNDGAEFIDRLSGRKDLFTPERVLDIQKVIGSDIAMVLDVCAPAGISKIEAREASEMTTAWARRAKEYVIASEAKQSHTAMKRSPRRTAPRDDGLGRLVFGIVQGSVYKDLRQQSARDLVALDFDGYAIGGVAVGESQKEKYQVLDWVTPNLPEDKPRYLMGLGQPEEIVEAVRRGVDMFDCVLPTRNARHGFLYVRRTPYNVIASEATQSHAAVKRSPRRAAPRDDIFKDGNFYDTMHITNEKYAKDLKPVDPYCSCFTCTHHTRAYLRHLFKVGEPLAQRLATIHNVKFYLELMEKLQEGILEGQL